MIKFEETKNVKISAKGLLLEINQDGLLIEDPKEGNDLLTFDELKKLVGKNVVISIANKEIVEEDETVESDEDEE